MLTSRLFRKYSDLALILTSNHKNLCKVILNKPKSSNSLCIPMMDLLLNHLKSLEVDPATRLILFSADGRKVFCSGGDLRSLYNTRESEDSSVPTEFFLKKYQLDYFLSRMRPLQVSIIDGIVVGGGIGIIINSPIRIATETSELSLTESAIGFYPSSGSTYFLPRLPGHIGLYLGLTAGRLVGQELVEAGLATHFVPNEHIFQLEQALIDQVTTESSIQSIEKIIENFAVEVRTPLKDIQQIERYFGNAQSVEEIFSRLADKSQWAENNLKRLSKSSPISLKVVFEQIKRGKLLSLTEAYKLDYRVSLNFMKGQDFFEGFRAMLLEKDKNPKWQCKSLEEVPDELIQSYFEAPSSNFVELDVEAEFEKLIRN